MPVHIPLPGPTQSLNVSVAASLAMYEYTRQHGIG
jgi:tRNA G18 (ribose-2'-O)-methylase SpoU